MPTSLEMKKKYAKAMESYQDEETGNGFRRSDESITSTKTILTILPEWMSKMQTAVLFIVLVLALVGTVFFAIFPFMKGDRDLHLCKTGRSPTKPKFSDVVTPATGLRTVFGGVHSFINIATVVIPLLLWYFKRGCKVIGLSQKDFPIAERTLYYSYSINTGYGQQVAQLGIAVSNILYALIILFRFEYFRLIYEQIQTAKEIDIRGFAITLLFVGLSLRILAPMVTAFAVDKSPKAHYTAAGLLFLGGLVYMIIEVLWIDTAHWTVLEEDRTMIICRRILCGCYFAASVQMIAFMGAKLWGFSSIAEVTAMVCMELYLLTYISSFRYLDGYQSYIHWGQIR